jgi:phosphatidylglycerophosphate synthase
MTCLTSAYTANTHQAELSKSNYGCLQTAFDGRLQYLRDTQITLSGFGFVVINFLTMLWYTPTLDQDCPPWVYASWAVGLFLYQTFDAVDGSQARRTHQSGPLGELFDHGVDAINTTLEVLLFSATMNLGQGWKTILTLFACKLRIPRWA